MSEPDGKSILGYYRLIADRMEKEYGQPYPLASFRKAFANFRKCCDSDAETCDILLEVIEFRRYLEERFGALYEAARQFPELRPMVLQIEDRMIKEDMEEQRKREKIDRELV